MDYVPRTVGDVEEDIFPLIEYKPDVSMAGDKF